MAKTTNKDVLQSYILTSARYEFSVYEKRILYRLVEMIQYLLEGKRLNDKYIIDETLFKNKEITMPLSVFLISEEDKNHSRIKKAFVSLQKKIITYEDDETWASLSIISNPEIKYYKDTVTFGVHQNIYNAMIDFSKGFKKYELQTAMKFESIYAMRFYELMSGQKKTITYSIDSLKKMFKIESKYKYVKDFKLKVIDAAKKELDKCSPYTFDYQMNKTGRAFTSVDFFPRYQPQFRDTELETHELRKQMSLSWDLPKNITDYLKHSFEFTNDGIKNNIDLFKKAHEEIDIIGFLSAMKGKIIKSNNQQGYVIGAIKKAIS